MTRYQVAFHQGGFYHVYNRGANRQRIFREDENYLFLLGRLKSYAGLLHVAVIAYCLMPNHYHFLLRQDGTEPAGLLIQRIFNSYTKAFNRRYERTGTLFEGEYRAIPVTREAYLLHLCRYIHANPARHGLVERLEDWPYSNYPEWLGLRNGTICDLDFVHAHFPDRASYGRFVWEYVCGKSGLPEDLEKYLARLDE
jgi:putative transposase